jgi:hypothetical protein
MGGRRRGTRSYNGIRWRFFAVVLPGVMASTISSYLRLRLGGRVGAVDVVTVGVAEEAGLAGGGMMVGEGRKKRDLGVTGTI